MSKVISSVLAELYSQPRALIYFPCRDHKLLGNLNVNILSRTEITNFEKYCNFSSYLIVLISGILLKLIGGNCDSPTIRYQVALSGACQNFGSHLLTNQVRRLLKILS